MCQISQIGMSENLFIALLKSGVITVSNSERIEVKNAIFCKRTSYKSRAIRLIVKKLEEARIGGSSSDKNNLIIPAARYTKFLEAKFKIEGLDQQDPKKYEAIERYLQTPECIQSVNRFFPQGDCNRSFLERGDSTSGSPHVIVEEPEEISGTPERQSLLPSKKNLETPRTPLLERRFAFFRRLATFLCCSCGRGPVSNSINAQSRTSSKESTEGRDEPATYGSVNQPYHSQDTSPGLPRTAASEHIASTPRKKQKLWCKSRGQSEDQVNKKASTSRSASATSLTMPKLSSTESRALEVIKQQKDFHFKPGRNTASDEDLEQLWNRKVMQIVARFDLTEHEIPLSNIGN